MKAKKIVSLVLAIGAAWFSLNVPVFAQEPITPTEETIDASLVARGYPQTLLDEMAITAKQSIYEDEALYFKGAAVTTYNQDNGTFTTYEIPADGAVPAGQIPVADPSLVWSVNGDRYNKNIVHIKYSYKWNNLPAFRWQDTIAVSWDPDLFEMTDDSFHKVDSFDGVLVNTVTGEIIRQYKGEIHSEEYGYATGFPAGVTWYADLKGHVPIVVTQLYGYAEFELEKKTSGAGRGTLYGHYVHPTISTTLGISILGLGSFSITGSGGYDDLGNQTTFIY